MRSTSLFWPAVNSSACEICGVAIARNAEQAAATRHNLNVIETFPHYCILAFAFGLTLTMSSARTHAGEPIGRRVLARVANWRAVLTSPRANAACADARSALARSPLRP